MQQERIRGGDNLVFSSSQEADRFRESVEQRVAQEQGNGAVRRREIVAEELVKKFEEHGVGTSSLHRPWEHSQEEHAEVQELVNTAFAHDLRDALRQAENSPSFPRNIDLFHDVLTGELYAAVLGQRLNIVHFSAWRIALLAFPVLLLVFAIVLFAYSI